MDTRRRSFLLLIVIYLGFVSLGLPDGSFGVAWPEVYPDLRLPLGLAGTIMTVGTLFTAVSGFSSGWVLGRWRTGPVVLVSCLLTAIGLLITSQARSAAWLYLSVVPLGFGAGAVDAGLNGYVAKHYTGRHMNWLHACWGIGATAGPLVIGWALAAGHGWRGGYLVIGVTQLVLAGLFLATLGLWSGVPERAVVIADAGGRDAAARNLPADSTAGWLSPAIFALYVAAELTTGLWAGTVLVAGRGFAAAEAAFCTACYYGAITGGRFLIGFIVDRWGNRRVIAAGTFVSLAGCVLFGFAGSLLLAGLALMLMGVGFAPVYPCLMHEVPRRFAPEAVQTVIGRQSGAASLGAAVVPALAGWIAQHSLAAVPWMVLAVLLAMIAGIRRLDRLA